jgi:arginase
MPSSTRSIELIGATSSIGIRPYDDGTMRELDRAPAVLREQGIVEQLRAVDRGDVVPPPYRDFVRPPGRARNEDAVVEYSRALGDRIAEVGAHGGFTLVLGGDCSTILGCLLGARQLAGGPVGLAYVDGHADFATPEESRTGSVASMCLGLAVGRGETPLARLGGDAPLVEARHVALVGRRDEAESWYGHAALAKLPILDIRGVELAARRPSDVASAMLAQIAPAGIRAFWIHLDADVLDASVMSAVDSPAAGGPLPATLVTLLTPLVRHPLARGLSLTIYDPSLDPDRAAARVLVDLLGELLAT